PHEGGAEPAPTRDRGRPPGSVHDEDPRRARRADQPGRREENNGFAICNVSYLPRRRGATTPLDGAGNLRGCVGRVGAEVAGLQTGGAFPFPTAAGKGR